MNSYDISVKQTRKNIFTFHTNKLFSHPLQISLSIFPDGRESNFIGTMKNQDAEFEIPKLTKRPYFLIDDGSNSFIIAERTLLIDGLINFRDIGGYITKDGKSTKWGMMYRGDQIHNAEDSGIKYLQQLSIKTIIDYRSNDEVNKYPNRVINENIVTYNMDPSAHTAEVAAQFASSKDHEDVNLIDNIIKQKNNGELKSNQETVLKEYRNFVKSKKSQEVYGRMLKIARNPNNVAIIQHCRGGKDRTGYGIMLLLGILGVPKDIIIKDYMLTKTNRTERNEAKMNRYRKITDDQQVLEHLYALIDTKEEFIEESINTIENEYGNFISYAKKELKLNDRDISDLQQLYLTK
ncbi:tyrosine-protein phosphatase [Xylocopilactobacillus apis]|uniref:Protein-tyrosine-phosphatase n=1 Tax=Xylocopilactobacillus apis TaxID=2932183 RepID=A0AAU9CPL8_9LACO|nr:tyrosine-protein phosphatase [Xylocopilactobacillus apis]BDR55897.1 hypothetical protein KIMC2_04590 [Xylocopilactobacillus apis]